MLAEVWTDRHAAAHPPAVNILATGQTDGTRLPASGGLRAQTALDLREFIAKDSRFDSSDGQVSCLPRLFGPGRPPGISPRRKPGLPDEGGPADRRRAFPRPRKKDPI